MQPMRPEESVSITVHHFYAAAVTFLMRHHTLPLALHVQVVIATNVDATAAAGSSGRVPEDVPSLLGSMFGEYCISSSLSGMWQQLLALAILCHSTP